MYNWQLIRIQICGLIILAVIYIFLSAQKSLKDRKRQLYMWVIGMTCLTLFFDILSIIVIMHASTLGKFPVSIVCKAYTLCLTWAGWCSYVYMMYQTFSEKIYKKLVLISSVCTLVADIVAALLPIYYYYDRQYCYTYGSSNYAVYAICAAYMLTVLFCAIKFRRDINSRYKFSMIVWTVIIFVCALIQYFYPGLLLVSFGLSLATLVLFITQENPLSNIDRALGCFNSYALRKYIGYLLNFKKSFSAEAIYIDDDTGRTDGEHPGADKVKELCYLLDNIRSILIFKDVANTLYVIARNADALDRFNKKLLFPALEKTDGLSTAAVLRLDYFDDVTDASELLRIFDYFRENGKIVPGEVFEITSKAMLMYNEEVEILHEIDAAMAEDRVEVFYQPIFSYETNKFAAAEALCRIRLQDGKLLSPGKFIPIAEKNGRISQLGERVIEKTCRMINDRDITGYGIKYIEINLSVIQCESEGFANRVSEIVKKGNVSPELINWEITETASMTLKDMLIQNMKELVDRGYRFSLDDFGKGESNLMYIVDMPVSIVKMDMDMTRAYFESNKAKEVLRTVVRMSHRLGLKVVCEGVETEMEAETLYYENVDFIQGYYYSMPLPEPDFIEIVKQVCEAKN